MNVAHQRVDDCDPDTHDSVQARFAISYEDDDPTAAKTTLSMPMESFRNPATAAPTVGPLAILVDAAAGLVNHHRRGSDQWTVSSELTLDLNLDEVGDLDGPVVASAHPLGRAGSTSLGVCTLTYRGAVIGHGAVRSFYIEAGAMVPKRPQETLRRTDATTFADLMAIHSRPQEHGHVFVQHVDPCLNNDIGIVHGGVASAGLELAASAAINTGQAGGLQTASVRVNFLRPFIAGADSRYEGTAVRVGRNTAVGDARAIGDDGKLALIGRVSAYR
ncbi:PaaI family thioesterase [Gordonia alkanivorans]|uniref:PaaI family thioesterase n=1 Tax=Gordonia alkanivorans TaxID=84096 RepID=UPI00244A4434|nr:PaaI family thioesterase [Gordonia alkanivorans]MDH3047249.1 PaaI family thioesterase [Gordonia alkanivorans]